MSKRGILKKVGAMAAALMFTFTTVGQVRAAAPFRDFDFYMEGNGGIDSSNSCKKEASERYASAYIKYIATSASPNLLFTMRTRARNDGKATETRSFSKEHVNFMFNMDYLSGYGSVGGSYYLRMQTNTMAKQGATVRGQWRP